MNVKLHHEYTMNIINMNNHEYPWTKGDNYSDMQSPMQDLPQLASPKISSCTKDWTWIFMQLE